MTDKMIELLHEMDSQRTEEWLYPIYVPTHKRAGLSPLLNLLSDAPKYVQRKVFIVCRASESKAYRNAYPWATIVEQRVPWGIGPGRMVCLQDADQRGFKRIVMLDDDITRVAMLEDRGTTPDGTPKSGRHSFINFASRLEATLKSLAFGCKMADAVFYHAEDVAYGSTRSGFMSSYVDVSVTAVIEARGFPLCVLFIDLDRFTMRHMPNEFRYEGEDLAMFLDAYEQGKSAFLFDTLVFDDDRKLATTIPFSGDGEIDRTKNLQDADEMYQVLGPYLKVTNANKETGAIKRIGVDWRRWHANRGTGPTHVMTGDVVSFIEGA
ncbi:glycosyltransferase [Microbacterium phage Mercedes]|nr:glycosyltransferase [Microbacterium phage Mercedes]